MIIKILKLLIMNTKISMIILLLIVLSNAAISQTTELKASKDTLLTDTIVIDSTEPYKIYSFMITGSWYHPGLDFFNEVFLPYCQVPDQFGPNYSVGVNVAYTLPYAFRTRVGISYWKDKVEGTTTSRISSLEVGLMRYKLGLLYAPDKLSYKNFQLYGGLDGQFFIVKHKMNQNNVTENLKGSDYIYTPFAGLEYSRKHFISSLEFGYNFGAYYQSFCECLGYTRHKVSVDGPEISISVGYKF